MIRLTMFPALQNVWKRLDGGENDRTPHGIVRVWPKPGKIPLKISV